MWACLNKNCPCLPFRNSQPLDHYSYDDDDNREFESLLAEQNPESIAAFLSRTPFQRPGGSEYLRIDNMVTPNEESLVSTGRLDNLLDDEDNLQTQDAQFLPDEQINKFTELIVSEQTKYDQATDAQLAAEEEEARRLEEEEIQRKRQAATEAAYAKGLITPDHIFTVNDEDDDDEVTDSSRTAYSVNLDGSSVELSTTESPIYEEEQNSSSLNKPRNPHERFVASEVNEDDYETDFDDFRQHSTWSIIRDKESKMEDYSPFHVSILRSDDYEISHEDYSPTTGDEEIDHPFVNILPDFERLGSFIKGLTNSTILKGKYKLINKDESNKGNINLNNQEINNLNELDLNNIKNNKKKSVTFTAEPDSSIESSSPISYGFAFGGSNSISGRRGLRKLVNGLSGSSRSSTEVNG
ncbi:320_t:CDS:2 [Funneliformis geosporum]|nr:320_t:CDS:2 [Funneliformis geosporum]